MYRKILSLFTALAVSSASFALLQVNAAEKVVGTFIHGDMNTDGRVNITDYILVKNLLTENDSSDLLQKSLADADDNGINDAADIIFMRKYLMGDSSVSEMKEFVYKEYTSELIPSSVANANSSTQSVGRAASLNLFVEFSDAKFRSEKLSEEELAEEFFGKGKTKYPFESLSAYLERASYGNFTIDGDVIYCTLDAGIGSYSQKPADRENLVKDVLRKLDDRFDYSKYDADRDGDIDILTVTLPLDNADSATKDFWYGATHTWYYNSGFSIDGVHIGKFIGNDVMPYKNDMYYLKQTYLHELGHSMGLSDYYKYASSDYEGLKGDAGFCRMDDSIGDYCTFSKLMLGWLKEDEVQIYSGGSQTFSIKDSGEAGSCVIIPAAGWDGSFTSEYFLVEYISDKGNNMDVRNFMGGWWNTKKHTGFRILHIDAEMYTDYWKRTDFKYDNYSEKYNGDDKQRIVRLVNSESSGFYKKGDTVNKLMSYDSSGYETVNSGYTVRFTEEGNGIYSFTVSEE